TVRVSFVGFETINKKISLTSGQILNQNFMLSTNTVSRKQLTIIGSRAEHTSAYQLAVPVTHIDRQVLHNSPAHSTGRMLEQVSPLIRPSHASCHDRPAARQPGTLRGHSPRQALVVINGTRWRPTALVQVLTSGRVQGGASGAYFGAIPTSAF